MKGLTSEVLLVVWVNKVFILQRMYNWKKWETIKIYGGDIQRYERKLYCFLKTP